MNKRMSMDMYLNLGWCNFKVPNSSESNTITKYKFMCKISVYEHITLKNNRFTVKNLKD